MMMVYFVAAEVTVVTVVVAFVVIWFPVSAIVDFLEGYFFPPLVTWVNPFSSLSGCSQVLGLGLPLVGGVVFVVAAAIVVVVVVVTVVVGGVVVLLVF